MSIIIISLSLGSIFRMYKHALHRNQTGDVETSAFTTYLLTHLPIHVPTFLTTYPPTYIPASQLTYRPTKLLTHLPTYLPTHLPTHILTHLLTYLPTYLYKTHWSKAIELGSSRSCSVFLLGQNCRIRVFSRRI